MVTIIRLFHLNYGRVASTKWKALRHLLSKKCHLLSLIDNLRMCCATMHLIHVVNKCWAAAKHRPLWNGRCQQMSCVMRDTILTDSFYRINALTFKRNDKWQSKTNEMGGALSIPLLVRLWLLFRTGFRLPNHKYKNFCHRNYIENIVLKNIKIKFKHANNYIFLFVECYWTSLSVNFIFV